MPVLFITFGLSLALGVIRLLLRGVGSCLALIVHPVRLVVRVLALAAQTLMVMLLLLVIAFLLMHFFAGSDAQRERKSEGDEQHRHANLPAPFGRRILLILSVAGWMGVH